MDPKPQAVFLLSKDPFFPLALCRDDTEVTRTPDSCLSLQSEIFLSALPSHCNDMS